MEQRREWREKSGGVLKEAEDVDEVKEGIEDAGKIGADGEGYVRFALVENEQRIAQAVRGIRRALG